MKIIIKSTSILIFGCELVYTRTWPALRHGLFFLYKNIKKLRSKSVKSFCKVIPKSIEFICYA